MSFFSHYRSVETQEKYPVLCSSELEKEFKEFEDYIKNYWSLKTCESFYLGVRTNSVESFFATRLFHVPKNVTFRKMYRVKMICCRMQWNETHISEIYSRMFGQSGIYSRMKWYLNVHNRVFEKHRPHKYVEYRIRTSKKRRISELKDQ